MENKDTILLVKSDRVTIPYSQNEDKNHFDIRSEIADLLDSNPHYALSNKIKFYLGAVYFTVLTFLFIKLFF